MTTDESSALPLRDVTLGDIARRHDLDLVGADGPLSYLDLIRSSSERGPALTYVTSARYFDEFESGSHAYAVVERRFARDSEKALLVCPDGQGEETFFSIHMNLAEAGRYGRIPGALHDTANVHPSAVVMDHVQIGEGSIVEAGAVIYPNTIIGEDVRIQPHATIGGEGFEVKYIGGRRTLIPHTGGVQLARGCVIGSATCIDRGLFSTFTQLGSNTHVDNLVHIAHNVLTGSDCAIVASAEISGSAHLGTGVWYGPGACCNHEIAFGDYSFVGSGSVVTRDVSAFTLVAGSPARSLGFVCRCRTRLTFDGSQSTCPTCSSRFILESAHQIKPVEWGQHWTESPSEKA